MRDQGIKGNLNLTGGNRYGFNRKAQRGNRGHLAPDDYRGRENALKFALTVPANVCPLEIAVINQPDPLDRPGDTVQARTSR